MWYVIEDQDGNGKPDGFLVVRDINHPDSKIEVYEHYFDEGIANTMAEILNKE